MIGSPSCTAPAFDTEGPGVEIDRRVKDRLRDGLSVYNVDAEKLKALQPDVIVTQSQCEVCAVRPSRSIAPGAMAAILP